SLVSGMPIWMVAVQQGGQIKDSFGGIGNASRALLKSINPLTLGIAAVGGAVVATGIAYYQGSREADEYNRALILTGNIAGTTADAMGEMAERIDGVSGTQGQAAAALAEIAHTGKFTAEQLEQIATSAVLMENTTGRAISATVSEFEKLADDPVKGVIALNDQYHFLTLAIYDQITALQEAGNETDAARLAVDTYASALNERADAISDDLGSIEKGWKSVKNVAAEAWDSMLGIGRRASLGDLEKELAAIEQSQSGGRRSRSNASDSRAQELRAEISRRKDKAEQARLAGEQQRIQDAAITAEQEIQKLRDQTLTKAEQKEKAIADYRRNVENIRAADPQSS
ncbi:MAG: phage tail tape measure protein, partial [Ketobacter sp.]|nr:phage tail tape measure protein [Ketobacter sp.]